MAPIIEAFTLVVSFSYCVALALAVPQSNQSHVKIEFCIAEEKPAEGLTEAVAKNTGDRVYLHRDVIITNKDMVEARVVADPDKGKLNAELSRILNQEAPVIVPKGNKNKEGHVREPYNIEVVLTKDGAEKLSKATGENLGKLMVLLIDGKVISAAKIMDRLDGKKAIIMGFTKEDAERFAGGINRQ
ncbi:MAG TPA: hypothetical protein VG324_07240 [Blastocatellia bacterium]|nr:hypothetical protein [Blastocatellia bacterium]